MKHDLLISALVKASAVVEVSPEELAHTKHERRRKLMLALPTAAGTILGGALGAQSGGRDPSALGALGGAAIGGGLGYGAGSLSNLLRGYIGADPLLNTDAYNAPTETHHHRRRTLAVALPTAMGTLGGGAMGAAMGSVMGRNGRIDDPAIAGLAGGLGGAVIGGGLGYGLGNAGIALNRYFGIDPMLPTIERVPSEHGKEPVKQANYRFLIKYAQGLEDTYDRRYANDLQLPPDVQASPGSQDAPIAFEYIPQTQAGSITARDALSHPRPRGITNVRVFRQAMPEPLTLAQATAAIPSARARLSPMQVGSEPSLAQSLLRSVTPAAKVVAPQEKSWLDTINDLYGRGQAAASPVIDDAKKVLNSPYSSMLGEAGKFVGNHPWATAGAAGAGLAGIAGVSSLLGGGEKKKKRKNEETE